MSVANLSLRAKLLFTSILTLILVMALLGSTWLGYQRVSLDRDLAALGDAQAYHLQVALRALNELILTEGSSTASKEMGRAALQSFEDALSQINTHIETPGVQEKWGQFRKEAEGFIKLPTISMEDDDAAILFGTLIKKAAAIETEANAVKATLALDSKKHLQQVSLGIGVFSLLMLGLLGALYYWLYQQIMRTLGGEPKMVRTIVQTIAQGDLTTEIHIHQGNAASLLADMKQMQGSLRKLIADTHHMVDASNRGDFSVRMDASQHSGFAADIAGELNKLAQTTGDALAEIARVAQALSDGQLDQHIDHRFPGLFGDTARGINQTVDALNLIISEIQRVAEAAGRGDLSERAKTEGHQGYALTMAEQINHLSSTTEAALLDIMRLAQSLAVGDLTHRIDAHYPGMFGQTIAAMNSTAGGLIDLIRVIRESVQSIEVAVRELAKGNEDLSNRTQNQSAALNQTAGRIQTITVAVSQNAESARSANQQVGESANVALRGGEAVGQVVETMESIGESSRRIAEIIAVIDGIAFQTNILALNAAVEAARAGEQGRGFAVVASEVRALAQRSADAAREIKTLIGESVQRVDEGRKLAQNAGSTMRAIVESVAQVTHLVEEIATASSEQAAGISQVNGAMSEMDRMTEQNAALVEEASAVAAELTGQAQGLSKSVSVFSLPSEGARKANAVTQVASAVDFDAVIAAHQDWKRKLYRALSGGEERQLDPEVVCRDDQCVLGKWLYGPGKTHQGLSAYGPLQHTHAQFHVCAADVLRKIQQGDQARARAVLLGDFVVLSNQTVNHIEAMRNAVNG